MIEFFEFQLRPRVLYKAGLVDELGHEIAGLGAHRALIVSDQGVARAGLLDRVRAVSGVSSASLSTMVPLGFSGHAYSPTKVEGYIPAADEDVTIERVMVSDGYFETMGVPIVQGRGITTQDRSDAQRVAVVNEAFANRYYHGQDPIGKRIDQGQGWATVVGVVKTGKYRDLKEAPSPVIYSSLQQWYVPAITLHIRTVNNPKMLTWARVDQLCLSCHSQTGGPKTPGRQPPSFHDISLPRYRNCTTCHVAIHGSNLSETFLK